MVEYVCEGICRYNTSGSLDQEQLDEICAECEMGDHICHILNEHIRGMGEKEHSSWVDRMINRFLQIN